MPNITLNSGDVAAHAVSLVANQLSTITFANTAATITVITDGQANVYYTTNRTTPTVNGANAWRIPNTGGVVVDNDRNAGVTAPVVKLIADAACVVSVQADIR